MSSILEMSALVRAEQRNVVVQVVGVLRFSPRDEQVALPGKHGCRVQNLRFQDQFW